MPTSPSPRRGAKAQQPAARPAPPRSLWPRLALIGVAGGRRRRRVRAAGLPDHALSPADDAGRGFFRKYLARLCRPHYRGRPARGGARMGRSPAGACHASPRDRSALGQRRLRAGRLGRLEPHAYRGDEPRRRRPAPGSQDFGLGAGWRGSAGVRITELTADVSGPQTLLKSAIGDITLSDVSSAQVASGANLGSYDLASTIPAPHPARDFSAALTDTGGPLAVNATIQLSMKTRSGPFLGHRQGAPRTPRPRCEASWTISRSFMPAMPRAAFRSTWNSLFDGCEPGHSFTLQYVYRMSATHTRFVECCCSPSSRI